MNYIQNQEYRPSDIPKLKEICSEEATFYGCKFYGIKLASFVVLDDIAIVFERCIFYGSARLDPRVN